MSGKKRKLIFVVTEDWYFWSHRLPMARRSKPVSTSRSQHASPPMAIALKRRDFD